MKVNLQIFSVYGFLCKNASRWYSNVELAYYLNIKSLSGLTGTLLFLLNQGLIENKVIEVDGRNKKYWRVVDLWGGRM